MNAMKNLIHAAILAAWGVMGAVFTIKVLLIQMPTFGNFMSAGSYWLWFGILAGFTTWLASKFQNPVAVIGAHAATLIGMGLIPKVFPLSLLRFGLDVLSGQ